MGGHAAGGKASSMVCNALHEYYTKNINPTDIRQFAKIGLRSLEKMIRNADKKIQNYAKKNKQDYGMGTTLSVLVLKEDLALIAHVGDSRIYRLRNNVLKQLTEDHTMAQLSVEMGYIEKEEASKHPTRHVLTEAIGQGLDEIQVKIERVTVGDVFLLCSDGLHHMVSDKEIKKILQKNPAHDKGCQRLVEAALKRGGKDNITVILVQV
jgi:protein phosphatase